MMCCSAAEMLVYKSRSKKTFLFRRDPNKRHIVEIVLRFVLMKIKIVMKK